MSSSYALLDELELFELDELELLELDELESKTYSSSSVFVNSQEMP